MDVIISGNKNIVKFMYSMGTCLNCNDETKISKFNYIRNDKKGYLIYNTLYNSLVRLSPLEYEKLLGKKKTGKELRKNFKKHGLIIAEKLDEMDIYNQWCSLQRKVDRPYISINITATLKCNARCYYCYESGVKHSDFEEKQLFC